LAEVEQRGERPGAGEGRTEYSAPIRIAALTTVTTLSQTMLRPFKAMGVPLLGRNLYEYAYESSS